MKLLPLEHKKTTASVQEFPNSARGGRKEDIAHAYLNSSYHTNGQSGKADFALIVHGNEMANVGYRDGDCICFHRSDEVIDNTIVAVLVDGECFLRRVIKLGEIVTLYGVGVRVEPIVLDDNDNNQIIGRAVELRRRLLRPGTMERDSYE